MKLTTGRSLGLRSVPSEPASTYMQHLCAELILNCQSSSAWPRNRQSVLTCPSAHLSSETHTCILFIRAPLTLIAALYLARKSFLSVQTEVARVPLPGQPAFARMHTA